MTFRQFQSTFNEILGETPLPDYWKLEKLTKVGLEDNPDWLEVLYRTKAKYRCKRGHCWRSSWSMILFRFNLDPSTGRGKARMKRFGLRCGLCEDNDEYNIGICDLKEVWITVQRLLLYIMQRWYEERPDSDVDQYIIPAGDVSRGKYGGIQHPWDLCEACQHDRCQKTFKRLTMKKKKKN